MKIDVYYPINNGINYGLKPDTFFYELAYTVDVPQGIPNAYEWAFKKSQNIEGNDFHLLGVRSCSVGDVMQSSDDMKNDICHVVNSVGFKKFSASSFMKNFPNFKKQNKEYMTHTFYKDHEGWFIDLPEFITKGFGTKANLAMVAGADKMLDVLSKNKSRIKLRIETKDFEGSEGHLKKFGICPYGENYKFSNNDIKEFKVWLCPVTKYVFGGKYPKDIYIKVI